LQASLVNELGGDVSAAVMTAAALAADDDGGGGDGDGYGQALVQLNGDDTEAASAASTVVLTDEQLRAYVRSPNTSPSFTPPVSPSQTRQKFGGNGVLGDRVGSHPEEATLVDEIFSMGVRMQTLLQEEEKRGGGNAQPRTRRPTFVPPEEEERWAQQQWEQVCAAAATFVLSAHSSYW
jgi:hypothetical protein